MLAGTAALKSMGSAARRAANTMSAKRACGRSPVADIPEQSLKDLSCLTGQSLAG
jgi:hypothetical protein